MRGEQLIAFVVFALTSSGTPGPNIAAATGAALRRWLQHGSRRRVFNLALGSSLAVTAVWTASA